MRAVTIAAAGAAVIGSVSASSHVENMHAQLHNKVARDTWLDWNSTSVDPVGGGSTTGWGSKPVDPATASTTTTTTHKVPSRSTTTSSVPAAITTSSEEHTWGDWTSSTSTTTTTKKAVDPATTSSSSEDPWADWESTSSSSSKPVDPATTSSTDDYTWADWESTSSSSSKPVDPATTSSTEDYTWSDWESATSSSSKPVDPASTAEHTWVDWSSSKPVDPATATSKTVDPDHTWVDWVEPTTTITLKSTVTTTKYVEPVTATSVVDPSHTWEDWESSAAVTVSSKVAPVTSIVTSTVVPGWSASGWFGPSWAVEPGSCAVSVITSYGLPTWRPVADPATTTETWGDWAASSTSTTPAAVTTTTSTSTTTSETWADWTTSSSVDPVTLTSTSTWDDWTLTVPTQAVTTATGGGWGVPSSYVSVSTSSSTGTGPKPSGGYPGITPNGDSWGLTYSPYTAQGGCKDAGTVAKDLAIVAAKGFSTVRVYSTDCNTLENIGKSARDNGLKLILGVWVSSTGIGAAKGQVDDIVRWGQWDLVELIVVGNEVIFNNIASASDLAGFISSSTWAFKAAGYTGPVTTTEPLSVWEDSKNAGALGGVIDVVGANLYAFFNAQISADKAGKFIQDQINILNGLFSGKPIYVLESGWPHAGNANGAAVPSPENQAIALKGIQSAVGAQVVFLSYEDEPWKEPGQFGVEQFWGCAGVF